VFWCRKTTKYMKPSHITPTAHTEHRHRPLGYQNGRLQHQLTASGPAEPLRVQTSRPTRYQHGFTVIQTPSNEKSLPKTNLNLTSHLQYINPQCICNIFTNSYLISGRTATKDCGDVRNTTHHSTITNTHKHTW
jgi:hypothetical protein